MAKLQSELLIPLKNIRLPLKDSQRIVNSIMNIRSLNYSQSYEVFGLKMKFNLFVKNFRL